MEWLHQLTNSCAKYFFVSPVKKFPEPKCSFRSFYYIKFLDFNSVYTHTQFLQDPSMTFYHSRPDFLFGASFLMDPLTIFYVPISQRVKYFADLIL